MARKFSCRRCGKPETNARIVVDGHWLLCGDCLFLREYGYREPTFLEEAVQSFEVVALFDADPYLR
jgi:hypothetical protein